MQRLPADFDVDTIGEETKLPADAVAPLRELAFRQARNDPVWFLQNFWHVLDPKGFGYVKFKLRDYQLQDSQWFVESRDVERYRGLVLKARQIGWTTMAAGIAAHDALFHDNHPWLISSQDESAAQSTLRERIKIPYNMLPLWLRQRLPQPLDDSVERWTLSNNSQILSVPATSKAGRSRAVFGCLLDEYAFVQDPEGLLAALDPLCYGPLFIFSTANGMGNRFHGLWLESQAHDTEWHSRFRPWNVVPNRDEKWYQRELRKQRGTEWIFYQEYPSNPEEAFAKTGHAALPMEILRDGHDWSAPRWRIDLSVSEYAKTLSFESLVANDLPDGVEVGDELWVWEPPVVQRDDRGRIAIEPNYVIGGDVAEGLEHGDRTSLTVWNALTYEVVATYRGYWPVEDLGQLAEWLGYSYSTALILIERNNHGLLPLDYLRRSGYPRLYRMDNLAYVPMDRSPRYGWHTNRASKPTMVNEFVRAVRDGALALHDSRLLQEAGTFVSDGKGGYGAAPGNHDDHVLGHMIGWQGVLDAPKYPPIPYDDEIRPVTFADIMDLHQPLTPSGLEANIGDSRKPVGSKAFVV